MHMTCHEWASPCTHLYLKPHAQSGFMSGLGTNQSLGIAYYHRTGFKSMHGLMNVFLASQATNKLIMNHNCAG